MSIVIDDQKLEQVKQFKYSGALTSDDGKCEAEIKTRIGMARDAVIERKEPSTERMSQEVKKKTVKAVVWGVG